MTYPPPWIVDGAGRSPTVCVGIVSAAGVGIPENIVKATPDDHLTTSPHRAVRITSRGYVNRTRRCPTVRVRIVFTPSIQFVAERVGIVSPPYDHSTASP